MKRNSDPFALALTQPLRTPRGLVIRRIEQRDIESLQTFYRVAALQVSCYSRRYHKRYYEIRRHSKPPVKKQRAFWGEQVRGWRSKPVTRSRCQYYFIFNPHKEIVGVIQLYWHVGKPTLGYFASPEHRGHGHMKEAVKHFVKTVGRVYRTPLTATAFTNNHASHTILKHAGFNLIGSTRLGRCAVNADGNIERKSSRPYLRARHLPRKQAAFTHGQLTNK